MVLGSVRSSQIHPRNSPKTKHLLSAEIDCGGNVLILWSNQVESIGAVPNSPLKFPPKREFGISLCHGAKSFSLVSLADRENSHSD